MRKTEMSKANTWAVIAAVLLAVFVLGDALDPFNFSFFSGRAASNLKITSPSQLPSGEIGKPYQFTFTTVPANASVNYLYLKQATGLSPGGSGKKKISGILQPGLEGTKFFAQAVLGSRQGSFQEFSIPASSPSIPQFSVSLDKASVTFDAVAGGQNPLPQTVVATLNGPGGFKSILSVNTNAAWLKASPSSFQLSAGQKANVSLGVNILGLNQGTYGGKVQIAAANGDVAFIDVVLTVSSGENTGAPAVPLNLVAYGLAQRQGRWQIILKWDDASSGTAGFVVEKRIGSSSSWSTMTSLPPGTTSYSAQLSLGVTYNYFRVLACTNSGGAAICSAPSNEVSVSIPYYLQ